MASNEVKDPELKQFATETLPTLQQHLQMAKTLNKGEERQTEVKVLWWLTTSQGLAGLLSRRPPPERPARFAR